jgi:DNA-binding NarL/FixJ family response regulator
VLVVHPHLLRRRALARLLRCLGCAPIHEAEDAAEAAALASQERLDVVFTPWNAGGLAGPALFAALRARGRRRAPAIVVLDEGLPQATIVAAVKAGAAGRLTLPATAHSLAQALVAGLEGLHQAATPRRARRGD